MSAPDPSSPPRSSLKAQSKKYRAPVEDQSLAEFAALLDDFMDEEVVDEQGGIIGTLACYWQSLTGLVFLGIKIKGDVNIRVVPGRRSQVNEEHACIHLDFEAADIKSAPSLDCAAQLDTALERAVYDHFGIGEADEHDGLRYYTRVSQAV